MSSRTRSIGERRREVERVDHAGRADGPNGKDRRTGRPTDGSNESWIGIELDVGEDAPSWVPSWLIRGPRFEESGSQPGDGHVEQEEGHEPGSDPAPLDEGEGNHPEEVPKRRIQDCEVNEERHADGTDEPRVRPKRLVVPRTDDLDADQLDDDDELDILLAL